MLIPLGFLASAGGEEASSFELIETQVLASTAASVTFASLGSFSSTYKHLQVRFVARDNRSGFASSNLQLRLNGDTASNYALHLLVAEPGTSSVASYAGANSSSIYVGDIAGPNATANIFGSGVIDILETYSTTKNKTIRALAGVEAGSGARSVSLSSGHWRNTNALTSITLLTTLGTLLSVGSRFSLYGIKG